MRTLVLVVLLFSVACSGDLPPSGDDDPGPDAGLEGDAAVDPDAGSTLTPDADQECVTVGDGSLYAQCCVWDAGACGPELACFYQWSPDNGADDGRCFDVRPDPPGPGEPCEPANNACTPGSYCERVSDADYACFEICDPRAPACSSGTCVVPPPLPTGIPWGDGTVGLCE